MATPKKYYPTEDAEHLVLVRWLALMKLPHHHSVNEMWTSSINQKRRNKRMGQAKGFPDLIVAIPPQLARNGSGRLIAIELKRENGGRPTVEQIFWVELLNRVGVPAK